MAVVYHWKHGWIPLDHAAALSKAKGNHEAATRMLADAQSADAGIKSRRDVARAARDLPAIKHTGDRADAAAQVKAAAEKHGATDLLPGSSEQNAKSSEPQVSIGPTLIRSEHYYAERRGSKMVNGRREDVWAIRESGTNRSYGSATGRDAAVRRVQAEEARHTENRAAIARAASRTQTPARASMAQPDIARKSDDAVPRVAAATDRQVSTAMTLLASALRSGAGDLDGYDYDRLRRMNRRQISAFITRLREQY